MENTDTTYIWQLSEWPNFTWQKKIMPPIIRELHRLQGRLSGKSEAFSTDDLSLILFDFRVSQILSRCDQPVTPHFKMEVETAVALETKFYPDRVNKRYPVSDWVKSQVLLSLDCDDASKETFNKFRIIQWYQWLKTTEASNLVTSESNTPQSIPKEQLNEELSIFIQWFNRSSTSLALDPIIRAAITLFWFSSIRPFDEESDLLAQSMTQLALFQGNETSVRLHNLFNEFSGTQDEEIYQYPFHEALARAQSGDLDITQWVLWFLAAYKRSLMTAINQLDGQFQRTKFWLNHHKTKMNVEQLNVLNEMLMDQTPTYKWGIGASQYMKIAKVSKATATRHLADLVKKGCLKRRAAGGRSTKYTVLFET